MSDRTIREVSLVSVEELFSLPMPDVSGHRFHVWTMEFDDDGHKDDGPPPSGSLSDPTELDD